MDWLGSGGPMIATRAIHFSATAVTAGALLFRAVIAEPVLGEEGAVADVFRSQIRCVAGIGLLVAGLSGILWLLLQAASMSGRPFGEPGVLLTVLNETQFGEVAELRAALAIVLGAALAWDRRLGGRNWLAVVAALGLIASLAWTGHAGATPGEAGTLHVAADVLHLCAASAWIGGLLSLIQFYATARRARLMASIVRATRRFSIVGIASVAILTLTGIVNAYFLVGSLHALMATEYGRLLILKLIMFAIMLVFAAINRVWLTPRLALSESGALRWLARNSAVELGLGLAILALVGLLGTLHPAIHLVEP
ncbi:copper homeostasis membrane protein CopD [Bradyrhizobium jicamae]|nr:copper homeostasis membrane protein CopD [Bradyrhizobium jicamae]